MTKRSHIGIITAWVSIAFSVFSSGFYFAFAPVFIASALFGAIGAVVALSSKARRTALMAAVFGMVPFGQLLVEQFFENAYLMPLPAAIALLMASLSYANYAQSKRATVQFQARSS